MRSVSTIGPGDVSEDPESPPRNGPRGSEARVFVHPLGFVELPRIPVDGSRAGAQGGEAGDQLARVAETAQPTTLLGSEEAEDQQQRRVEERQCQPPDQAAE